MMPKLQNMCNFVVRITLEFKKCRELCVGCCFTESVASKLLAIEKIVYERLREEGRARGRIG